MTSNLCDVYKILYYAAVYVRGHFCKHVCMYVYNVCIIIHGACETGSPAAARTLIALDLICDFGDHFLEKTTLHVRIIILCSCYFV